MKNLSIFALLMPLIIPQNIMAQSDSLILINGDVIIGEFKDMDRGVIGIETAYSDSNFKIEWEGIKEIYSVTKFLITIKDGHRYMGAIQSTSPGKIEVDDDKGLVELEIDDIVFLKSVDEGFWSRLSASIDLGLSTTKANNFRQVTMRSIVGYVAERWSASVNFNTLNSSQDETDDIKRTDGGINFNKFLENDWYIPIDVTFLSNTEQKLNLRLNGKVGIGKFVIHTNTTYWGFAGGASFVQEDFSSEDPDRQSMEAYFGTELNLYDIGDLSLLTKVVAYPSITESKRWRTDFVFDTKYDLPLDFYIKLGLTVNYDNKPVEGAVDTDYVFSAGFGWEW